MVDGKEIDVFTTARLTDHTGFYGEVFVSDVNVGEKMVESNFCFKKPGLEQRGMKGRGQGMGPDIGGNNR